MGFDPREVRAMEALTVKHLQRLSELGANFMDFRIDHDCFNKLLDRLTDERQIEHLQDDLLGAGAPVAMMHHYWGMTAQDCASRRRVLGLETLIGRPQRLSDDELEQLWHLWAELDGVEDDRERYVRLAERSGHSLTIIWPVVEAGRRFPDNQAKHGPLAPTAITRDRRAPRKGLISTRRAAVFNTN